MEVYPLGATIARLTAPKTEHNVVLAFPSRGDYASNPAYLGETIGRVANRIAGARIECLNGRSYDLAPNGDGGKNCLHGGVEGWGKKIWDGPFVEHRGDPNGRVREVERWSLRSEHGDGGFPGTVMGRVWYGTSVSEKDGVEKLILDVEYEVELLDEAQDEGVNVEETVCALTNHSYFNLSSNPTIQGTELKIATALHLPVDDSSIPLGEISPFPSVQPDKTILLGTETPSFDHCFVVNEDARSIPPDTRPFALRRLISMYHADTKINLVVESTEPAFQLYTGEGIDGAGFGSRAGIAVEPSRYVNAVNDERWRGMVVVKKDAKWGSRSRYITWKS